MVDRAKKAPGNVQPLPAASSMLILEASGRPFNISLDFRSGARPSPPPCGDVRARALERDRGRDLVKSRDLRSGAAVASRLLPDRDGRARKLKRSPRQGICSGRARERPRRKHAGRPHRALHSHKFPFKVKMLPNVKVMASLWMVLVPVLSRSRRP